MEQYLSKINQFFIIYVVVMTVYILFNGKLSSCYIMRGVKRILTSNFPNVNEVSDDLLELDKLKKLYKDNYN